MHFYHKVLNVNFFPFKVLSSVPNIGKRGSRSKLDPRPLKDRKLNPLTESDIDMLADITNGNSGLVRLKRKQHLDSVPDIEHLGADVDIATSEHIDLPKPLSHYADSSTYEEFIRNITITPEQQELVETQTCKQSACAEWYQYRQDRITASKFGDCVTKINDDLSIRNPTRTKTVVSNVCGYYDTNSNNAGHAASYGISNESVARKSKGFASKT